MCVPAHGIENAVVSMFAYVRGGFFGKVLRRRQFPRAFMSKVCSLCGKCNWACKHPTCVHM